MPSRPIGCFSRRSEKLITHSASQLVLANVKSKRHSHVLFVTTRKLEQVHEGKPFDHWDSSELK